MDEPVGVGTGTRTSQASTARRLAANGHSGDAAPDPSGAAARAVNGSERSLQRRVGAAVTAVMLVGLVGSDLSLTGVRAWWDHHSFTSCVVSSLVVLGATVLIVDEIVGRRQRKERAVSVAVQGLIVYGQALRAYDVVTACRPTRSNCAGVDVAHLDETRDEVRNLASMVLVASPSLFDDPDARLFLEEVQRMVATMYGLVALARRDPNLLTPDENTISRLRNCKFRVQSRVAPLATRLPGRDSVLFDQIPDV